MYSPHNFTQQCFLQQKTLVFTKGPDRLSTIVILHSMCLKTNIALALDWGNMKHLPPHSWTEHLLNSVLPYTNSLSWKYNLAGYQNLHYPPPPPNFMKRRGLNMTIRSTFVCIFVKNQDYHKYFYFLWVYLQLTTEGQFVLMSDAQTDLAKNLEYT